MATTTICDLCEEAPRQAGEEHKSTPATWTVEVRTIKESTISTAKRFDTCDYHLGEATKDLSLKAKTLVDFHSILATTLA